MSGKSHKLFFYIEFSLQNLRFRSVTIIHTGTCMRPDSYSSETAFCTRGRTFSWLRNPSMLLVEQGLTTRKLIDVSENAV